MTTTRNKAIEDADPRMADAMVFVTRCLDRFGQIESAETILRVAALARELDVRLCRINGERAFVDEIPADWPVTDPIVPSCDFLCSLAEMGLTP